MPAPIYTNTPVVPRVWKTVDSEGGECYHLAMGKDGAIQAHLLHHGMLSFPGEIDITEVGTLSSSFSHEIDQVRDSVCLDPHCVFYGLSFPEDKE